MENDTEGWADVMACLLETRIKTEEYLLSQDINRKNFRSLP